VTRGSGLTASGQSALLAREVHHGTSRQYCTRPPEKTKTISSTAATVCQLLHHSGTFRFGRAEVRRLESGAPWG
jgi:hypothetical protein